MGIPYWKWMAGCVVALGVAGCAVGPDYHPPKVSVPEQWSESMAGGETNDLSVMTNWWTSFGDLKLDSLVERAVNANLQLRVAAARVREARAQRGVVAAGRWPSLDASGSYTYNRISENYFLPLPPGTPLSYNWFQSGFDAAWELDLFGRVRREVEAANADIAAAEFSRRDVLVTLLAEVARNYFEARSAQNRLDIIHQNIDAQKRLVELTTQRYRAGVVGELDVQQAKALLADTEAEVPSLETVLDNSIHRVGVLLGQPPGALSAELRQTADIPAPPPRVPVGLPSDLVRRRPDIQRAERQLAAATARIGVAKADLYPHFSLTGNAGLQSVSASTWFDPSSAFWTVGPTVTWRVFDAGRIRSNIRVQNAREEEALASYEQTVLSAFEDVENALGAYAREQVRYRSLENSVAAERAALKLAQDLYSNGLVDFIRVLEAQRSLYQAQDSLVQSQAGISQNLVALYKALGGGWEIAPMK
jgi:NodT family efflux transporter outer membrane factor (OMF) lipoprotein